MKNKRRKRMSNEEKIRLQSFRNYPQHACQHPAVLALNGFVYCGRGSEDTVVCNFCYLKRRYWKAEDDVTVVHRTMSPNCPMATGLPCDNVPFSIESEEIYRSNVVEGYDSGLIQESHTSYYRSEDIVFNPAAGVIRAGFPAASNSHGSQAERAMGSQNFTNEREIQGKNKAIEPQAEVSTVQTNYLSLSQRAESFKNSCFQRRHQTPEDLARAGFYYSGYSDGAICFYCGIGLRNWQHGEGVWIEHARWSPRCAHLLRHLTNEFISAVQKLHRTMGQSHVILTYDMVAREIMQNRLRNATADRSGRNEREGSQEGRSGRNEREGSQEDRSERNEMEGSQEDRSGRNAREGSQEDHSGRKAREGSQEDRSGRNAREGSQEDRSGRNEREGSQETELENPANGIATSLSVSGVTTLSLGSDVTRDSPEKGEWSFSPARSGTCLSPVSSGTILSPARSRTILSHTSSGTILLPASSGTILSPASSGTILSPARSGTILSHTSSGTILLPASSGTILSPARSGTILSHASSGTILLPASSGTILLPTSSGTILSHASSGTILLPANSGAILLPASSGTILSTASSGTILLPTSSGTILLPASSGAILSSASSGTILSSTSIGTILSSASSATILTPAGSGTILCPARSGTILSSARSETTLSPVSNGATLSTTFSRCDSPGPPGPSTALGSRLIDAGFRLRCVGDLPPTDESQVLIKTTTPKHERYRLNPQRKSTFSSWPFAESMSPTYLSNYGFFYRDRHDWIACFLCGCKLKSLQGEDRVQIEHALRSPDCPRLRLQMGQGFVDLVQSLARSNDHDIIHVVVSREVRKQGSPLNICDRLRADPAVRAVKDMGYPTEYVLEIAQILKMEGEPFSAIEILEKIKLERDTNGMPTPSSQESGEVAPLQTMNAQIRRQILCKICMVNEVAAIFLPCGHLVSCELCVTELENICPVCRGLIKYLVPCYFAMLPLNSGPEPLTSL